MKRLTQPLCPWCGCQFPQKRSIPTPPICHGCHAILRGLPTEKLIEMVAYFAGYSQVALHLLVEGDHIIRDFTGVVHRHRAAKVRSKKPQRGIAMAPIPLDKRSIA